MAQLGLVPNAVLHLRCKGATVSASSDFLQSVMVSSGAATSTLGPYSAFVSSSMSAFDQDRPEKQKESQDSGIAVPLFARPHEADLETPLSYLSSIIAPSVSLTTAEFQAGKKSSQKTSVGGGPSHSQATVGAVSTATSSPILSPRHSPCPSLPTIPPNLHPALAPTAPLLYVSKDQGSEMPSTTA